MNIEIVKNWSDKNTDKLIILSSYKELGWASDYFGSKGIALIKNYAKNKRPSFSYLNDEKDINVIFIEAHDLDYKTKEIFRLAGNTLLTTTDQNEVDNISIIDHSKMNGLLDFTEGVVLGSYSFDKYKTDKSDKYTGLKKVSLIDKSVTKKDIKTLNDVCAGTCVARDLVNEPFSYLTATKMSEEIEALGEKYGFGVEIFDKTKIESLKMGGILAVNKGSVTPPRFNILTHKPKNAVNKKPIVLVGKGIVYDTGGLSIKPTGNSMDFMKSDMGGAATVIGTFVALAAQKLPLHVVGLVPSTDNVVSAEAYAPGDVITMYDGTTVEVMNTDAEGRLILADALHHAKKYKPELVLDFATLTGAAAHAVGTEAVCMMGNAPENIKAKFKTSGENTYERMVEFPMWEEYKEYLKSHIADLRNLGTVPAAGMVTAGKFLEHFTDYDWLHFDIAGSAFLKSPKGYRPKEGTGVGVRLCFDFLKNY